MFSPQGLSQFSLQLAALLALKEFSPQKAITEYFLQLQTLSVSTYIWSQVQARVMDCQSHPLTYPFLDFIFIIIYQHKTFNSQKWSLENTHFSFFKTGLIPIFDLRLFINLLQVKFMSNHLL